MNLPFVKMEGCANDFIVVQPKTTEEQSLWQQNAVKICDRRIGVGGDGVILISKSSIADFAMRIFNSDGSEPEMCGNGIRCCARYIRKKKLSDKTTLTIETKRGLIGVEYSGELIRVNMGAPVLDAPAIPVALPHGQVLVHPIKIQEKEFLITAVSMGNPHAVIFTDTLDDKTVLGFGPQIEVHPLFPKKVNVEFIKVLSNTEVDMRVWERGCGETMACGTGACASVVAGILNKKHGKTVTVHLRGGDLTIEWDGNPLHPVYMTGPANSVFEGNINL